MALEYVLRTATGLLADLEMTNLCGLEIGAEMSEILCNPVHSWFRLCRVGDLEENKIRDLRRTFGCGFRCNARRIDVIGIVTSKDLSGEKMISYLNEVGGKRADVMVRDLMTPQLRIEVMEFDAVAKARVGDLVESLKRMGRQHALVVETDENGRNSIRGVLSAIQIGKQLGISIDTSDVAGSLAALATR